MQILLWGERISQALPHTVRISEVTVVAIRTTVEAIQTTPALQVTTSYRLFIKSYAHCIQKFELQALIYDNSRQKGILLQSCVLLHESM